MHTGGEPVRIVVAGYPQLTGATLLDKRREARERHDDVRRLLMHEPRGHADMYGVIPVEPDHPGADLAVLFCHNEGYSTMCGHATIAVGRWAVDSGQVTAKEPWTEVGIQVPCGLVRARVRVEGGVGSEVFFESVPAFAPILDASVDVPGHGPVRLDVAYGGAYYALVAARTLGLDVRRSPIRDLVDGATAVSEAVRAAFPLIHPDHPDLGFLYGTILTDGEDGSDRPSANVCVFADRQVDRSPTGSGVTARIARQYARGAVVLGEERSFSSVTGAVFTGRAVRAVDLGGHRGVTVEVGGRAHYTGHATFTVEADDPLGGGFLLR